MPRSPSPSSRMPEKNRSIGRSALPGSSFNNCRKRPGFMTGRPLASAKTWMRRTRSALRASRVRPASYQILSSRPTRTPPPQAIASQFIISCESPMPATLHNVSGSRSRIMMPRCSRSAWARRCCPTASWHSAAAPAVLLLQILGIVDHARVERLLFGEDIAGDFISRARAWIMSGELTLASRLKLMELRVKLPISGFWSPVSVSGSERFSIPERSAR